MFCIKSRVAGAGFPAPVFLRVLATDAAVFRAPFLLAAAALYELLIWIEFVSFLLIFSPLSLPEPAPTQFPKTGSGKENGAIMSKNGTNSI